MNGLDEILAGYPALQADQEAFYKDLHRHPELSHRPASGCSPRGLPGRREGRAPGGSPSNHSPNSLPPLQPTLRTGTETLVMAALAWLAPRWASSYVTLPAAGLYQPIWTYDAKTLAEDLSAHLAYGAGTAAAFRLLATIARA